MAATMMLTSHGASKEENFRHFTEEHTAPRVVIPSHTSPYDAQTVVGRVSPLDHRVEQFCGIPYGYVSERWQHSTLRRKLPDDVFDASKHGPKCPQPSEPNNTMLYQSHLDFPAVEESEFDCLNLFISRPSSEVLVATGQRPAESGLPVYVYIHGGGFGFGAGTDPIWDPTRLVQRAVEVAQPFIAVNINYRLNIFGFAASSTLLDLQTASPTKGCNFGIHDQKVALRWVKQNISYFGGDCNKIVLGGQSAGGCSVNTHLLDATNSVEAPLFKRAIIQSGAFTSVGIGPMPMKEADHRWNTLCKALKVDGLLGEHQLEALRTLSSERLLQATKQLGWMIFSLVCDGMTVSATSEATWDVHFGSDSGLERGGSGFEAEDEVIQVLIGDNESEGSCFVTGALGKLTSFDAVLEEFEKAFGNRADALEMLATYGIAAGATVPVLHQGIIDFTTDSAFAYSVRSTYQVFRKGDHDSLGEPVSKSIRPTKTQLYRVKFGNPFPGPFQGNAHHCVDLIYQFDTFHHALLETDREEAASGFRGVSNLALVEQMQSYWISFISGEKLSIDETAALVYENDRRARMESFQDSPYWSDLNKRLDVIGKFRLQSALALERLMQM